MSIQTIIRAWKDAEFRASLSQAERAALPANPAGVVELSDAELQQAAGGFWGPIFFTLTCPKPTSKEAGCVPNTMNGPCHPPFTADCLRI
jgi:mersacidin/lichenicidin family type 2 lantibiotic